MSRKQHEFMGKKVDEINLFTALAVTGTTRFFSPNIDLRKYKSIYLLAYSSLNQIANVGLSNGNTLWMSYHDGSTFQRVAPPDPAALKIPIGSNIFVNTYWEFLNDVKMDTLALALECPTAPTSGSITIKLLGVKS